ncbi:MAG: hypothetical protein ACJ74J_06865 [Blastocatellia bacterium]
MKKVLGFGILIFGVAGIIALGWVFFNKPKSSVKVLDKEKWYVELDSNDGWFDTGIPVVTNERIKFTTPNDADDNPLMVRLDDQIVYLQRRKAGVAIEAVEWATTGGFTNIPADYKGNLFLKIGNKDFITAYITVESSLIDCSNSEHQQAHAEAKDWWHKQSIKLTEK